MRRELHDGLVLRSISEGMVSDRENLAAFGEMAFSEGHDEPDEFIGGWIRSLLQPDHPAMSGDDIWVVADPAKDEQIVSMLLLIPQLWRYESVKIPVGRVEIVATQPDYRRRGLIRDLMQVAHERSAAIGHHVQAITGIPHFYRQFGYTMAVDLGAFATVPLATIPKLKDDQQPQFTVRPATEADIPKLVAWDAYHGDQMLLSTVRSEAEWRYELARHREHIWWLDVLIVTAQDGREVGYVALRRKFDHWLPCLAWIIGPESSYVETFEDVLRGIQAHVQEQYADSPPAFINFGGGMHDVLHTMIGALYPGIVREHS
ncbi:MAG: GNAT family N-acetyltransferase, partial [Anaerolineae bacterium]|nr:GNAT family N-acetyltransferase [Anaerolineae bacterium]